jgi:hypothetical protein
MQGFLVTISDRVDSGQTRTIELKPNSERPIGGMDVMDGKSPAPSNRVVGRNGSQGCDFGSRPHQRDGRIGSLSAVPVLTV